MKCLRCSFDVFKKRSYLLGELCFWLGLMLIRIFT